MRVTHGRVVLTRHQEQPYKVVMEHEDGENTEFPVRSIREGEDLIRLRLLPRSPELHQRPREW